MDLDLVATELASKLDSMDTPADMRELHVHEFDADSIVTPGAFVSLPDTIDFGQSYAGYGGVGAEKMSLDVMIMVGRLSDRIANKEIKAYASATGPLSVRNALDSSGYNTYESCDEVTVMGVSFVEANVSGVSYLAAVFRVEIEGPGS